MEEPITLDQALNHRLSSLTNHIQETSVKARLIRKFGWGTARAKREKFYSRIQAIIDKHGEAAELVVREVEADSVGKDHPDRWFCRGVIQRLKERGLQ